MLQVFFSGIPPKLKYIYSILFFKLVFQCILLYVYVYVHVNISIIDIIILLVVQIGFPCLGKQDGVAAFEVNVIIMNSEGNIILQTPQNAIFFKTCQQGNTEENTLECC